MSENRPYHWPSIILRANASSHLKSAKKDPCLAGTFFLHSKHTQLNLSTTRARCHCILSVVGHSLFGHFCSLATRPFFFNHSHRSPSRPATSNGSTVVSKKLGSLQTPGMMMLKTMMYQPTHTYTPHDSRAHRYCQYYRGRRARVI